MQLANYQSRNRNADIGDFKLYYTNMEIIAGCLQSAATVLAYFHHSCRGPDLFSETAEAKEAYQRASLSTREEAFMAFLVEELRKRSKLGRKALINRLLTAIRRRLGCGVLDTWVWPKFLVDGTTFRPKLEASKDPWPCFASDTAVKSNLGESWSHTVS